MKKLFTKTKLGNLELKNHIVMAPLTRSRAINNIPNDLMVEYYTQRAGAGLIITEGSAPSENGLGYARIPGIFSKEQIQGWKKITKAVHEKGSKIFIQIMHTGRASHPLNMKSEATILAPSAIALTGTIWTDQSQLQPYPVPKEMSLEEIKSTQDEYVHAAKSAIEAGFDGVELHSANGYLLEQFLHPNANKRSDSYGGSDENRMRFVLETAKKVVDAIGANKVGIRISPYGVFNDTGAFPGIDDFFKNLSKKLSDLGLVYIHLVDHSAMGAPTVPEALKREIKRVFKGTVILSGGYDANRAESDLLEQNAQLIAFGRPFISNPNLVEKLQKNLELTPVISETLYTPGAKGYTDYV